MKNRIRVTICGALGKMGQIIIKQISNYKLLKLDCLIDIQTKRINKGFQIKNNNLEAFKSCDVIIDFSNPKSSIRILNFAKKLKKKLSLEQQVLLKNKKI